METWQQWQQGGRRIEVRLPGGTFGIFVRERGEGPVVTLVHGFPMSSYDWARLEPLLAQDHRVVSLDLLGYGGSDVPTRHRYSTAQHADVVQAVWRELGVTSTALVGHDVGTGVARELLTRHDEGSPAVALTGALFLNGALILDHYTPKRIVRLLARPVVGGLIARSMDERRFTEALQVLFADATRPPAAEFHEYWTAFAGRAGTARLPGLVHFVEDNEANEQRWLAALAATGVPVSVVWGRADTAVSSAVADDVARRLPRVALTRLDGVGHAPHVERPDVVADAVRALVTSR
ncbi:MAG TPA: alpha/beta hydrolase [Kineosporiaceae bacterium]|nr:alpha/beta hydrolase [Kineosporiaceae bacterium]